VIVCGIDPGTHESAVVLFNGVTVEAHGIHPNETILTQLRSGELPGDVMVIEMMQSSYGMPVGKETFETVFTTGRFAEAWYPKRLATMGRPTVKQHLCQTVRATDANIRQAIIDRFGPTVEKAIGRKASPGPLYGLKSHEFAALAIALTWYDQNGHLPPEVRPGIRQEF